jgi:hypothetical protein
LILLIIGVINYYLEYIFIITLSIPEILTNINISSEYTQNNPDNIIDYILKSSSSSSSSSGSENPGLNISGVTGSNINVGTEGSTVTGNTNNPLNIEQNNKTLEIELKKDFYA